MAESRIIKRKAIERPVCPVSHGSCRFCTLFRSRHYQAFRSCQDYLQQHHKTARAEPPAATENT